MNGIWEISEWLLQYFMSKITMEAEKYVILKAYSFLACNIEK